MKQRAVSFEPKCPRRPPCVGPAAFMTSTMLTPSALRSRQRCEYQEVIQVCHGRNLLSMEMRFLTFPSNQCRRAVRQCSLTCRRAVDFRRPIHPRGTCMTNLKRLAALLPLSVVFIAPAISGAQQHAPIAEQIGKAYGVDSFGQVEAIRYTFNIPAFKLSRTWVWEPKTDTVSYEGREAREGYLQAR